MNTMNNLVNINHDIIDNTDTVVISEGSLQIHAKYFDHDLFINANFYEEGNVSVSFTEGDLIKEFSLSIPDDNSLVKNQEYEKNLFKLQKYIDGIDTSHFEIMNVTIDLYGKIGESNMHITIDADQHGLIANMTAGDIIPIICPTAEDNITSVIEHTLIS